MAASQKLQHFIQQQVELHTTVEQNLFWEGRFRLFEPAWVAQLL
jgi:hypothetical protein